MLYYFTVTRMIREIFHINKLVPEVIDVAPLKKLDVTYMTSNKEIELGNEITAIDAVNAPKINYEADPDVFYTLMMVDPDAPSRRMSFLGEWQHWLVGNIPGSAVESGETIREYSKIGPPPLTGLHRYVFLLFQQPDKITFKERHARDTYIFRAKFSARRFSDKYNLGNPVAGNFFHAKH